MSATSPKPIDRLRFENICFGYDGMNSILQDASYEFPVGEIIQIMGPSGSGKSAVLRLIAGIVTPLKGNYLVNEDSIDEFSFEEFIPYRLNMGYSFDFGGLIANKTLFENLALPMQYHSLAASDEIEKRVYELMAIFDLINYSSLRPSAVSGSRRKATVVARSLVLDPELLILDDPTTGLDKRQKSELKRWVLEKKANGHIKTVLLISEDQKFTEGLVTHQVKISDLQLSEESMTAQGNRDGVA